MRSSAKSYDKTHPIQPAATVYLKPAPQILDMSQELLFAKAEILKQRAIITELQTSVQELRTSLSTLTTSLSSLTSSLHPVATSGSYSNLKDRPVMCSFRRIATPFSHNRTLTHALIRQFLQRCQTFQEL
jgi:hypothetical protein